MEMNFCRRCGKPLKNISGHVFTCSNNHIIFRNSCPCAGILLINEKKEVLLVVRALDPGKGKLHYPAGFCDDVESIEQTLKREIFEELGLTDKDYSLPKYLFSNIDPYEYKGETVASTVVVFWAKISLTAFLKPGDDAADAFFVPYDKIDFDKIQFDTLKIGLRKLHRMKII
jgi:ADP-ribose pyrophosphatase